jgi:adenine/guanine phosphoribosyltransferase-like PRPP-binding protein
MTALNITLAVIGVLGTIGTFYFGIKSLRLERQRRSFTWRDIQIGATELLRREIQHFRPDLMLVPSGPGAAVASIAMTELRHFIPTYTIVLRNPSEPFHGDLKDCYQTKSGRWEIFIPKSVLTDKTRRILVFDDCVMTGDTLSAIRQLIESKGIDAAQLRCICLVCSRIAADGNKSPDAFWHQHDDAEFYFPWGKWY